MTLKQITGKKNQRNGHKFEIKVWNKINHKMCLARCISSGSKGLFDVWSLQKNKLRVASCKMNGKLSKKEKRDLKNFMAEKPTYVQVEIWFYKSPKKIKKTIIKTAHTLDRF